LNALGFLHHVLPSSGWLIGFVRKGDQRKQQAFASAEKLLAWLLRYDADGWDAYHAVASFCEPRIWNERRKKWELRSHENVAELCELHLDIDTRESKPNAKYADRQEAWEAVVAFCKMARIPLPTFVSSGGGLHCYWPLDVFLDLAQWEGLAKGLKAACAHFGLAADPSRTADASSVLRTPGTHHHKTGRVVEHGELTGPYPVEQFEHLKGFASEPTVQPQRYRPPQFSHSPLAAAASSVSGDESGDLETVARNCRQLGQLVGRPGACPEPLWYAACGLAAHCGDAGREWLHGLATSPEWIPAIDAKIAQWEAQVTGPPTCAYFESHNPGGCEGCPHQGRITSPIILGRGYYAQVILRPEPLGSGETSLGNAPQEQSQVAPQLPAGWDWGPNFQLLFKQEGNQGENLDVVVSEHAIYLSGVHAAETTGLVSYTFQQYLPQHGWRAINIGASVLFSSNGMGHLADSGAVVRDGKLFVRYVHDHLGVWHKVNRMEARYEQCGWKEQDTRFLIGNQLYGPNGITTVTSTDEIATRAQFLRPEPGGDVREWTKAANQAIGGDPVRAFAMLASFAAPLMRWQSKHEGGTLLSLVSRLSGTGKTFLLNTAASVWGTMQGLEMSSLDTQASRGLTFAVLGNLPVVFDELGLIARGKDPEALRNLVMLYSVGHDKARALQHGRGLLHSQNTWQGVLITASNVSILDQLAVFARDTDAPQWRVLELRAEFPQHFDYAAGDRLRVKLFENAGHAGAVFISYLLQPQIMDYAQKALEQWTAEIWKATKWGAEYRFYVRLLGCIAVAGDLVRSLGLLAVDPMELIAWAIREITNEVTPQAVSSAVEVLGQYIMAHTRNKLTVQEPWRHHMDCALAGPLPTDQLKIRQELKTGRLFTPVRDFKDWVVKYGVSYGDVMKQLIEAKIVVNSRRVVTLGAGTSLRGAPIPCIEFDMNHSQILLMPVLVGDLDMREARQ